LRGAWSRAADNRKRTIRADDQVGGSGL
jgi:hypothetical protein